MPLEKILLYYTHLQHLNQEFNCCFSNWVLVCFYIFHVPIIVLSFVFIIVFHKDIKILYFILLTAFAIGCSLGIGITFPYAGSLYSESMKLRHFLVFNRSQTNWSMKRIRAFIPLKIAIRNFIIVQKQTGLITLAAIFYCSLRIIVLLK